MSPAFKAYGTAKGYVQSSYVIVTSPLRFQAPDDTTFLLSLHMLLGFAAEIYLKSYLIHKGTDAKTLRSPEVRHSLSALSELCVGRSLVCPELAFVVSHFDEKHASYEYRYMQQDSKYELPNLMDVFNAFSSLDLAVDMAIGASASEGRAPGGAWLVPAELAFWRIAPQ